MVFNFSGPESVNSTVRPLPSAVALTPTERLETPQEAVQDLTPPTSPLATVCNFGIVSLIAGSAIFSIIITTNYLTNLFFN